MSNLQQAPESWLKEQFEHEWCSECGRDHRHHTAIPFVGNWFARCDRDPMINDSDELVINPEGYDSAD